MSKSLKMKQLSRSKLELFLECPRCFYADVVKNRPRIAPPAFTLNIAVCRFSFISALFAFQCGTLSRRVP
jgi:hypothetical protein